MAQEEIPKPNIEAPPATQKLERYSKRVVDLERLVRGMEKHITELNAELDAVRKDRDELAALITEDAIVNEGASVEDQEYDSDVKNSGKKQTNKFKQLALYDERTGVKSRLGFERMARLTIGHQMKRLHELKELEKAEPGREVKNTETLTFIMVDLDFFKKINDTYGHPAGDEAMRKVGETLRHSVRDKKDFAGRWGGDEFILCITSKGENDSRVVAERIRNAIADIVFDIESTRIPMSASIGVVNWEEGDTLEEMVDRADKAQYIAKRAGRNQVIAEVQKGTGKDRTSFYMFEGSDELIPKVEVQEYLQSRVAK